MLWLNSAGRFGESILRGEELISADSSRPHPVPVEHTLCDGYVGLGIAYASLGQPDGARSCLVRAIEGYTSFEHFLLVEFCAWHWFINVHLPFGTDDPLERAYLLRVMDSTERRLGRVGTEIIRSLAAVVEAFFDDRWDELERFWRMSGDGMFGAFRSHLGARAGDIARQRGQRVAAWAGTAELPR